MKYKKNFIPLIIILVVIAAFTLGVVFINKKTVNIQTTTSPTPEVIIITPSETSESEYSCQTDSDCVVGIQTSQCCSCPQPIPTKLIGKYNFEAYESGKDYSKNKGSICKEVQCSPCQIPITPSCVNKECTFSSEGQFCGGIAGKVCPDGYECQMDGNYPDASGKCIKNSPKFGDAQSKEECLEKGGTWTTWGIRDIEYCQIPSNDYENDCTDGSECYFGKCISKEGNIPGKCQKYRNIFGCFSYVNNGVINSKICVD